MAQRCFGHGQDCEGTRRPGGDPDKVLVCVDFFGSRRSDGWQRRSAFAHRKSRGCDDGGSAVESRMNLPLLSGVEGSSC